MVLDILAISAVIFLAFALLFRRAPVVIKIQVENIHGVPDIPETNLKEMLEEIGKTEEDLYDTSKGVLGFINGLMQGEGFDEDPKEDKK